MKCYIKASTETAESTLEDIFDKIIAEVENIKSGVQVSAFSEWYDDTQRLVCDMSIIKGMNPQLPYEIERIVESYSDECEVTPVDWEGSDGVYYEEYEYALENSEQVSDVRTCVFYMNIYEDDVLEEL